MEKPKNTRSWFIGISLGTLFALCLWPTTRGLIKRQVLSFLPFQSYGTILRNYLGVIGPTSDAEESEKSIRAVVGRYPDDEAIQFAEAVRTHPNDTPDTRWNRLNEVVERFPDSPSIHSNALRMMCQYNVRVVRSEEHLLIGEPIPSTSSQRATINTPEHLAAYDRACEEGEALDPDNAVFPFLRAIGFFAAHRDEDALAALHLAATKSRWEEYARYQTEGEWRLLSEAADDSSAVLKVAVGAGLLLPHYSQVRSVARVATWKAVEAEKAGQIEEGLAIRRSLRQIGSLMRVQSPVLIGNVIGIALTKISLVRPGGAPYVKFKEEAGPGEEAEARLRAYETWLQKVHLDSEENSPRAEVAAGMRLKKMLKNPDNPAFGGEAFWKLIGLQIGTVLVFSNAFWILFLDGVAALKLATHALSKRQRTLMTMALSTGILVLGVVFVNGQFNGELGITMRFLTLLLPGEEGGAPSELQRQMLPILVLIGFAVPLLTLMILACTSRACRVPLSVGVPRGLRGSAPLIGCALLLLYSGLIVGLARQEKIVMTGMDRTLQHEGRYLAELRGTEWPGPVR